MSSSSSDSSASSASPITPEFHFTDNKYAYIDGDFSEIIAVDTNRNIITTANGFSETYSKEEEYIVTETRQETNYTFPTDISRAVYDTTPEQVYSFTVTIGSGFNSFLGYASHSIDLAQHIPDQGYYSTNYGSTIRKALISKFARCANVNDLNGYPKQSSMVIRTFRERNGFIEELTVADGDLYSSSFNTASQTYGYWTAGGNNTSMSLRVLNNSVLMAGDIIHLVKWDTNLATASSSSNNTTPQSSTSSSNSSKSSLSSSLSSSSDTAPLNLTPGQLADYGPYGVQWGDFDGYYPGFVMTGYKVTLMNASGLYDQASVYYQNPSTVTNYTYFSYNQTVTNFTPPEYWVDEYTVDPFAASFSGTELVEGQVPVQYWKVEPCKAGTPQPQDAFYFATINKSLINRLLRNDPYYQVMGEDYITGSSEKLFWLGNGMFRTTTTSLVSHNAAARVIGRSYDKSTATYGPYEDKVLVEFGNSDPANPTSATGAWPSANVISDDASTRVDYSSVALRPATEVTWHNERNLLPHMLQGNPKGVDVYGAKLRSACTFHSTI